MSKYYTPDFTEFHIGFRFEHLANWEKHGGLKWRDFTIEGRGDIPHRFDDDLKEFRVKYLDKSDIEELGWKFDSKQSNELLFYKGHKSLTIFDKTYVTIFNEDDSICFDGQIKNYNELFKLQNMLGI